MSHPDAKIIALLKIALRNLTAVAPSSAARDYAVVVLEELGETVPKLLSPTGRRPGPPEHEPRRRSRKLPATRHFCPFNGLGHLWGTRVEGGHKCHNCGYEVD